MHDSLRYIEYAKQLQLGVWPTGYVNWYAGYCFLIFAAEVLNLSYFSIVVFQIVIALIAVLCLFDLVHQLSSNRLNAFIIAVLFATSFQVQVWNMYILTESVFVSGILISIFLLYKTRSNRLWLLLLVPVLLFTVLQRPNGFILPISALLYLIVAYWYKNRSLAKSLFVLAIISAGACLIFLHNNIAAFVIFFKTSYLNGEIICSYKELTVSPNRSLLYDNNDLTLRTVYDLIGSDISYFFKLAFLKLFFLFSDIRPYYSLTHNLYIISFLVVVYFLFGKNVYNFSRAQPALFAFIAIFIFMNACLIMITYTDWDGRFLAPLIGPILLIAGGVNKDNAIGSDQS